MAIITFMSDFGMGDHYVAAVKAKILSINPGLRIVDISHYIEPHNIAHASFVLKSVFRDFPKGTVHLVAVDAQTTSEIRLVACQLEGHYFVGQDNGLFSLLSEEEPSLVAQLFANDLSNMSFPAKDVCAKAAAMLASGSNMNDVGTFTKEYQRMIGRKFRATKKQISGNIIRVDRYGNLITNIEEEVFNILHKDRPFVVSFGREKANKLNNVAGEADDGDCYLMFNSLGLLEIGINKGNASELLGLKYDSPVNIDFEE